MDGIKKANKFLVNIKEDIEERERELLELRLLYKDKKIPYKLLDERIEEIMTYIKEDIKEQLHIY